MGVGLAWISQDVSQTLTVPYSLLGVSLFVPIVAGLYVPRTSSRDALLSIAAGIAGMLAVLAATRGGGWGILTPALAGLTAAIAAWMISLLFVVR
jgi:Na+/pantothenate symporter